MFMITCMFITTCMFIITSCPHLNCHFLMNKLSLPMAVDCVCFVNRINQSQFQVYSIHGLFNSITIQFYSGLFYSCLFMSIHVFLFPYTLLKLLSFTPENPLFSVYTGQSLGSKNPPTVDSPQKNPGVLRDEAAPRGSRAEFSWLEDIKLVVRNHIKWLMMVN